MRVLQSIKAERSQNIITTFKLDLQLIKSILWNYQNFKILSSEKQFAFFLKFPCIWEETVIVQ